MGMGYGLGGLSTEGGDEAKGLTGREFGHGGNGGSLGFADPSRRLGFGFVKTLMTTTSDPRQAAGYRIASVVRDAMES